MQLHENFYQLFGVEKSRRVGQLTCAAAGLELNPPDRVKWDPMLLEDIAHARTEQVS